MRAGRHFLVVGLGLIVFAIAGFWATTALAATVSTPLGQSSFASLAVDDANQHVFVSAPSSNEVLVYDFSGSLVATIPNVYGAYGMVIVGSTLYVAENSTGTIEEIDLATLAPEGSVGTGLVDPHWLAYAGGELWTDQDPDGQWGKIVSVSMTGQATVFPTTYYSPDLATSPATPNTLYVAEDGLSAGAVFKLDVSSGSPVLLASNPSTDQDNIEGLAVSPDGTRVIPASGAPYKFVELSASTLADDGIVYPGQPYPSAVAVSPGDGGLVATGLNNGYSTPDISVFKLGTPSAIFTASTGTSNGTADVVPHGLALSADGTKLFAVTSDNVYETAFHLVTFDLDSTSTSTALSASPGIATAGQQVTLTATVAPTDGGGDVTFTANGAPIAGCSSVALSNTSGSGTATCTTTSLPVGADTIAAEYTGDTAYASSSGTTNVTVSSADPIGPFGATVNVGLNPSSIAADGTSTTMVTATVRDGERDPVPGDAVSFSAYPAGAVTIGPVTDHGNGTYTARIISSTTTGQVTITAADNSATPIVRGQALLTETSPQCPSVNVGVRLGASTLIADGEATTTATATVRDGEGNPIAGDTVSFAANPVGAVTIGPVTDHGNGTYTATITSSAATGAVTITATDTSAAPSGCAVLTFRAPTQGVAADVILTSITPSPSHSTPVDTGSPSVPGTAVIAPTSSVQSAAPTAPRLVLTSPSQIKFSLAGVLTPRGPSASIKSILKHGFYSFRYSAPDSGRITIDWYGRTGRKRLLVGAMTRRLGKAGKAVVTVRLTKAGRLAFEHAHRLVLTSSVSFVPTGDAMVSRSGTVTLH